MILQMEENKGVELTVDACNCLGAMECGRGVRGESQRPEPLSPNRAAPSQ
jgi:hypothetical protein